MIDLMVDKDIGQIDGLEEELLLEENSDEVLEPEEKIKNSTDTDNLLNLYLKEIAPIPLLKKEEEIKYGQMVMAGQKLADAMNKMEAELGHLPSPEQLSKKLKMPVEQIRQIQKDAIIGSNRLITSNLRLVVSIAKKYKEKGLPFDDLIQEGNLGLMRAVEKFDPSRGFKFSTYATWWIRQAISRGLSIKSRTIRLPLHIVEATQKIKKAIRKMTQENGKRPENEDLAKELDIPVDKLRTISEAAVEPISLDIKLRGDDEVYVKDLVQGSGESPEDYVIHESLKDNLEHVLDSLTDKEKEIIRLRFGLDDGQQKSLQEIADHYGLTRERVRQIVNTAMKKLRSPDKLKTLVEYLDR
jgi:RNA polymerase primary sigma factor